MSGTESRAPGHDGPPVTLRAILKPKDGRPGHVDLVVTLVGRTGRGKVVVRSHLGTWSVDTFRLWSADDRSQRVRATDLATLPWNGKGPDPLNASSPGARLSEPLMGSSPQRHEAGRSPALPASDPSVADYRDTSPASPGRSA